MTTTYTMPSVIAGHATLASDFNGLATAVQSALNSFDGGNIQVASMPGNRLQAGSVPGSKIIAGDIGTTQLAAGAVTTAKCAPAGIDLGTIGAASSITAAANLLAANSVPISALATGVCRMVTGKYTGDGNPTQAITGLAFSPTVVLIASNVVYSPVLRLIDMPGAYSTTLQDGNGVTDGIISLDPNGFTVGNSNYVNGLGVSYKYVCLAPT